MFSNLNMDYREILLKYKLHHLLVWLLFFAGWFYFRNPNYPNATVAVQITAVKVSILAILVYFTNYLLIPVFLNRKKYLVFAIVYLSSIIGLGIIKIAMIMHLLQPFFAIPLRVFDNFKARAYDNIIPLFLLVSTGAAAKMVQQYIISQKNLAAISREKTETELQYLRGQLNPHFLFNSLNAVYFLIDKTNAAARDTLLRFSDLLRYQLYDCSADKIDIAKELVFLSDYMHLHEIRLNQNYEVELKKEGDFSGLQITPLLLIPFVENAFKHVSHHSDQKNFIRVAVRLTGKSLHFSVFNSKEESSVAFPGWGGIGLANVRRRLDLLYPEKYTLEIKNEEQLYAVTLVLQADEISESLS
ncbi:MAG: histidine kinase [Gemmatimonadaceae bacterium]|nr:histidine kinase [Chitinophagaceae bacterium]